eukprot:Awhi_evm2s9498
MHKFIVSLNLKEWNQKKKPEQHARNAEMSLDQDLTVATVGSIIDEKLIPINKKKTVRFATSNTPGITTSLIKNAKGKGKDTYGQKDKGNVTTKNGQKNKKHSAT